MNYSQSLTRNVPGAGSISILIQKTSALNLTLHTCKSRPMINVQVQLNQTATTENWFFAQLAFKTN